MRVLTLLVTGWVLLSLVVAVGAMALFRAGSRADAAADSEAQPAPEPPRPRGPHVLVDRPHRVLSRDR